MASGEQSEAIKLLGDWCKWLVTIETAAIAAIVAMFKDGGAIPIVFQVACSFAVPLFLASIVVTGWTMLSLPTTLQNIPNHTSIWDFPAYLMTFKPPIWKLVAWQCSFFLLGLAAFAVGAIGRIWG